MQLNLVRSIIVFGILLGSPVWVSCKDKSTAPGDPQATKPAAAKGLVVEGEKFSMRIVKDDQQGGLALGAVWVPAKWQETSKIVWNYQHTESPVEISFMAENPDNAEAYFGYPSLQFFGLRPDSNYYQPGQNYLGSIFAHQQQAPAEILLWFVRQARGGFPNFKVIGNKDLPDLAVALKSPTTDNQRGLALKVTYELKGKPVEEEFYAVSYSGKVPYDGPQGRTWEMKWGLGYLHSFRAPVGALDHRRAVFAAIIKSFRLNPAWEQRRQGIVAYLADQFNRQLQAGYDSIAAAGQLSRQISANNDAMIAAIDRKLTASRSSSGGASGSARGPTDNFDDYIRGVDTVEDPYRGTSQHSSNEQYHWTDGYGNYRHSNDAGYDPNRTEIGGWQLMPFAR
jgi:hypothetical protein